MLNTFYGPGERTGSVVRHAPAWAESPVRLIPAWWVFSGYEASRRKTVITCNPFHQ